VSRVQHDVIVAEHQAAGAAEGVRNGALSSPALSNKREALSTNIDNGAMQHQIAA
jgi:hypothetical protein